MTREQILQELAQLKKQHDSFRGSVCQVYGKNKTSTAGRVNGCCVTPATRSNDEKI